MRLFGFLLMTGWWVPVPIWTPSPEVAPYLDALRCVNVALTVIVAAFLFMRINDIWHSLTIGRRLLFTGMWLFPAVLAYGSAEAFLQQAPTGLRTPLVTVACAVTLFGVWVSRHDVKKHPYSR